LNLERRGMRFVPFEQATPDVYDEIGFMSGLEVHQQLLTRRKLFCRCPAGLFTEDWDAEILRHMRPTLSEMGDYDGTALMEFKTRKNITYRLKGESVCTYEMDDTPPFLIDDEALDITIEICHLLNLNVVGELHIMRKQYLDGSIPTGFQRTGVVGANGSIPYGKRTIGITQVSLEEDSCREMADDGHERVYITDRLGMPLIETVTDPDMRRPHEVADVAQIVRRLTRATGKVRTGMGAARMDVNVSCRGGTRVEIKGVPRIPVTPELTHNEAFRQHILIGIRDELRNRGVTPESFEHTVTDVRDVLREPSFAPMRDAVFTYDQLRAVRLCGFGGLLGRQTQPGVRFAREFSDRVRVIACLDKLPNIVTTDDPLPHSLTPPEWAKLRAATGATEADAVVVVWGAAIKDVETAVREIVIRAQEALAPCPVPSETRQYLGGGRTGFERILPGPSRMYPDTDLPPIIVTDERYKQIAAQAPIPPWAREQKYRGLGLPASLARKLSFAAGRAELFDEVVQAGTEPMWAAVVLNDHLRAARRAGPTTRLTVERLRELFTLQRDGSIARSAVPRIMREVARMDFDPRAVAEATGLYPAPADDVTAALTDAVAAAARVPKPFPDAAARTRFILGTAKRAGKLHGRIDGPALVAALKAVDR
jgi:glutamyl-tRNA(Gln) amidotransferase subunit E